MKSQEEKLGKSNILKLMFQMGIPILIAQLINLLYSIVDRIYIGHIENIGRDALTGIGITMPIILIVTAFSYFIGGGGAPLATIALGENNKEKAEKILGNGVTLLVIFTVLVMVVFYAIKTPFLYLIGASKNTIGYADNYISIYLIGTIFVELTVGLNPFITAQGNAKTAMFSVLIGAAINIILDPILIFGFNMGITGAAVATVIAQAASALWIVLFLISKKASLKIKAKNLKLTKAIVLATLSLGLAPFIMMATESVLSLTMNSLLKRYGGDLYVAAFTVAVSVMQFITVPVNAFAQGVQPIMSYNFGAGNVPRVKKTYKYLFVILCAYSVVVTGLIMIFPGIFGGIFSNDADLIQLVKKVLPIFVAGMLVFGIQNSCQPTFVALGQTKLSLFFALLRKVILLIPLAIILPIITKSAMSIFYAELIADALSALICGIVFMFTIKKILLSAPKSREMQEEIKP